MRKKDLWIVIIAVCAALVLVFSQFAEMSVETGAWGLSFRQEGQPPSGPAGTIQLAQYDAAYLGDPNEKILYLTFDAGYENGNTAKILDVLKKHGVPATFFLVGHYIQNNADLVRRMVDEGHTVGNHTMHHRDMSKLADREVFSAELTELETLFRETTGQELPKYYRPPQGVYSEENLKMAKELGYKTVFWSLAYADWDNNAQPSKETAFSKLLPRIHNGAVILLHSTSATNTEILDELITTWESQGYRFEAIDKLFS